MGLSVPCFVHFPFNHSTAFARMWQFPMRWGVPVAVHTRPTHRPILASYCPLPRKTVRFILQFDIHELQEAKWETDIPQRSQLGRA